MSSEASNSRQVSHDLVGGTFAVIESDPGVFSSLIRKLGIPNLEVVELYSIDPWAVDHLSPYGLIFCYLWGKDKDGHGRPQDEEDPAAKRVWFANQLSDDACASQAILNVLLNCPDVELGDELKTFKDDTEEMNSVMKGLAISNCPSIRRAQNSLARPADIRGALNAISKTTLKHHSKTHSKPPPAKRRKLSPPPLPKPKPKPKPKTNEGETEEDETFHFIGYVPAYGKVWELDGLKSGPLEVGELPETETETPSATGRQGWMDVVRPAIRMKMDKFGGGGESGTGDIRFNLLAIVDCGWCRASDEMEMVKKERGWIEGRLGEVFGEGWKEKVDPQLLLTATQTFKTSAHPNPDSPVPKFMKDFGAKAMAKQMEIMEMPERDLVRRWEECVRKGMEAKVIVEDEWERGVGARTEHLKRTHDYEPFIREFITRLHAEGLLNPVLGKDENGRKVPVTRSRKKE
ncbi:hypothetical protein JAAARDRAFT_34821 [Jaapia argillacea MUCL 33604]|uniref:ubiquitinyl hydrolase 1 n=1 Tax=Jaapia argillacea MUCL 33604 TaxID=933084 RepID=A0A067Q3F4_9AGAM|nr:hypothetical protein JAAARDRAFT_34821 [Jaapia argillacea MUCL 33604]